MISKNNMTASYHMSWNPKPTQNVQASIERRFAPNVINASLPRTASDAGQRKPQLLRKQSYINAINGVDQSSSDYIKHIRTHFSKSYSRRATTESLTTRLRDHQHEASSTSSYRSIDDCKVHSRRRSDPFVLKLKKLIATNSTSATSASFKVDQSMKTPTRRFASPSKATTLKEGHLCCKSVVIQNKRATDRSWRHGWVILRDTGCLYIYHASASALHLVHSPPVPQPSSVSTATYSV